MNAYQRISRYKSQLMGIAILIVVYGHFFYYHSGLKDYTQLNITMWYTVGSVDIFMFLSGFGIYHSLSKNDNPLRFFQRRMSRLLPSYLPFIVLYCVFSLAVGWMNKFQALGNLTTFGWWGQQGGQFNWYIPTIIGMYLFSPLFYHVIKAYGRKSLWVIPLLFLIETGAIGSSLMIGVSRFPIYFLGMYLGKEAMKERQLSRRHLIVSGLLLVVSMVGLFYLVKRHPNSLSRFGFWWHPFLLSTPGCLYFTTWCLEKHEKWGITRWINRALGFLGSRSFEIYLWHLMVYSVALYLGLQGWGIWIVMAILGIAAGCVYSFIITKLTSRRKS